MTDKPKGLLDSWEDEADVAVSRARASARQFADTGNPYFPPGLLSLAENFVPGSGAGRSMRLATEARGQWNDGRYGRALDTMGDAVLAPLEDVIYFLPGGGIVRKATR